METMLRTKLFAPPRRLTLVPRQRLIAQLNLGLQLGHRLTLISAPAGFGKTTLANEWVQTISHRDAPLHFAWLSLDEGDNDLARFLAYLITALDQMDGQESTLGVRALAILQAAKLPPAEVILTPLINEIANSADRIAIVLDDYHHIDAQPVHDAIGFLLENSPPQLHLIIATREDPFLPLTRLRARAQLTELRAADLRFTFAEAADFLNQVMGLDLSAENIAALETRTEGWITGLQLAAISMQRSKDRSQFIKSFTGSHRYVLDYLVEEVLAQQPGSIQDFLLQTAVLQQLTGSLCDALTGQNNGQATLEMLEHANLFVVPLDEERHWYRYHHLFADLLRQRLRQTHTDLIPKLHLRASAWYAQHDQLPEAIQHALAAKDFTRAADLAEIAWEPMNMKYQAVAWLGLVKAIPNKLVRSRPVLSTGCGWASLDAGDLEAAERYLQDAESWLDRTKKAQAQLAPATRQTDTEQRSKGVVVDAEQRRALSASIANARAYLAQALGDVTGTVKYARRATDFLREDDHFERGLAQILPGFAYWTNGELAEARLAIADAIAQMQTAGKMRFVISFTSYLADIMVAQGRLNEAKKTCLALLETATEQGKPEIPETAVLHLGLCEIYHEQGEITAATEHLQRSEELGEQHSFAPWYRHWVYAHARLLQAQGDQERVLKMLNQAERLFYRHPIPDVRPLKSLVARALLAQGRLSAALDIVQEQGLSIDDDLRYLREFAHITLARLLIAQHTNDPKDGHLRDAQELLERLLNAAEEGQRVGSVIEILILQALAFAAKDNTPGALTCLERALTLAKPEGYFRIFVDEGRLMARLLQKALNQDIAPDYARRLLASWPVEETLETAVSTEQVNQSELAEPLSERELEVLQKIAAGLTNREIGERLYLSLNTVKVHTRNIYGKLGVHNRTQAVAKARDLGILSTQKSFK